MPRASTSQGNVDAEVRELIAAVAEFGSQALIEQSLRFDGCAPSSLVVSPNELEKAARHLDSQLRGAIEIAIDRVRRVSQSLISEAKSVEVVPGGVVTNRFIPVGGAGVYVPGGKASYPSSAVMNVVAAQVAGVSRIVLVSPIRDKETRLPDAAVMAAAHMLGIEEFLIAGGAGAIAALAYGLPDIGFQSVNAITGPGNRYVAAAKGQVASRVAIDSEAGPTEILVLADATASPKLVAADLISQAEHDEAAAAVLVTDSVDLAHSVSREISNLLESEPNRDRAEVALSGSQSAALVCTDWQLAIATADAYAAEHLSLQCVDPASVAKQIRNAGAIFLGANSPVSLGDYLAGSNHVLPTAGAARRQSALSPLTFLRLQQVIEFDHAALAGSAEAIRALSKAEGLPAHFSAVSARLKVGDSEEN